jgi:hypothetical protein
LSPDGSWRRDAGGAVGTVRIASARLTTTVRAGVEVVLAYDERDAPLRLLVDGAHRPEATPRDGVLRAWLPEAGAPREIAVGLAGPDGRIRVLERFWLAAGAAPELLPGAPAAEGSAP